MLYYSRHRARPASSGTAIVFSEFMGATVNYYIDYTVTHEGYAASYDDPGAGAEFEIDEIRMAVDNDGDEGPEHIVTGKHFVSLVYSNVIDDAVSNAIDRSYDYYHDDY
jgi:hypothetical protein